MIDEVVIFDVWSSFAYFRKSATTTTALTFPFIPRSAVEGLIGAILGLEIEETPDRLGCAKIAVEIRNPVRKIPFGLTYTDTKEVWPRIGTWLRTSKSSPGRTRRRVEFRTPVKIELLQDPCYRICFAHEELAGELDEKLRKHETVFTPYLGTSSMIANFKHIDSCRFETLKANGPISVSSMIPFEARGLIPKMKLNKEAIFAVEQNIPIHLSRERVLCGTYNAVYNPLGKSLTVDGMEVHKIQVSGGIKHVIFLPTRVPSRQAA